MQELVPETRINQVTRRLVDVAHDVIIHEEDCGTLRGLVCTEIKNNEEVVASSRNPLVFSLARTCVCSRCSESVD